MSLKMPAFHKAAEFAGVKKKKKVHRSKQQFVKPKSPAKPRKEVLKRFGTENNDGNKVCGHLYLSSPPCDTLLNIPIGEWAETQPHEFKWAMP